MNNQNENSLFSNLKYDIPAGLIVFLVAVPLCLGIALASGAPLFAGIISGIIGGIVVTLFSGSPLGVSGPAAGLAVIVLVAIQDLGSYETFLMAVVLGGVIQLGLGFLKAGVIGYYFPSSVIKGMLSGIGILIILKQIPHALGYDKDPEGDFSFVQVDGHNTFTELGYMCESISPGAALIASISMAVLIIWELPFMKRIGLFKIVQGPLVVVLSGILMSYLFRGLNSLELSNEQLVSLPVSESFRGFLEQFTTPDFTQILNTDVITIAVTIAIVASLETLLCVEATDKLDPDKRVTPTDRELKAQGIGNIVSGLIGGLPITQVIVRSSANIQSGGRTRASAFVHGVMLLACALLIPNVLNMVPLASLAAILLVVGYKLTKLSLVKGMIAEGKAQYVPFFVTVLGIVFTDLLVGIGLGMITAIFHILWSNYKIPYHFDTDNFEEGAPIQIHLPEVVSFLHKASILRTLGHIPEGSKVIIDAVRTRSMHPDVYEIITDYKEGA
ncbi:MAG: SulP family inorganic anion transporter, partial [Flavobacteriales bacterium]|nr:SulP family inorganic anion transporter [Flavobacteriales bacterium]